MNKFILWINEFSFAVWDKIPATVLSTWLLYAVIIGFSAWLIQHNKKYFKMSMVALAGFVLLMVFYKWQTVNQLKLIVYNVPKHQAIDLVSGNAYQFIGDSVLLSNGLLQNFHLKPARISLQLLTRKDSLPQVFKYNLFYRFQDKKILIIDRPLALETIKEKIILDLVVISKNPPLDMVQLTRVFNCKLIVFDASNSLWKIKKWQQDCAKLNQPTYTIPASGAFVYNIGI